MNLKSLLFLLPLALGIAGFMWMNSGSDVPEAALAPEGLAVRVLAVKAEAVVVKATGYGRVAPVRSWSAVAEVDGRITALAPALAPGIVVEEGAVVVQIDRTDTELSIRKSKANIASADATLAELERQEANSRRLLDVEERILQVARAEYDRVADLVERGSSSQATLDQTEKTLLAQETSVTNLQNTIDLYPAQRASAEATLAVREAELAEAERALANTTIRAPFRGRVASDAVEVGQFVRTGEQLLKLDGVEAAEIVAEFSPLAFTPVIGATLGRTFQEARTVDANQVVGFLVEAGVTAEVHLEVAELNAVYPARLARFRGSIDSTTGTIGMAVQVDDPMVADGLSGRPPLNVGSFVAVDLSAPPLENVIAIPRAAIHQDDDGGSFVYLADADDRLAIAPVVPGPLLDERVLIRDGLAPGDRLVLSAPRPPIQGLALTPVLVDGDL
ncbi:MAG: efflux RND transporter periplasmic adaptor subunit [Pseudomonadota bacterium]